MGTHARVIALALALFTTTVCQRGQAEPKTHDGFYFKAAGGIGYLSTSIRAATDDRLFGGTSASAVGFSGLLAVGGTPVEHLVLGGAFTGGHFATPTLKDGSYETDAPDDFVFSLTGPFAAYYFDQHQGLHVLGMLGFALLDPATSGDNYAQGAGAAIGVGYDLWVGDEWSIGGVARAVMMRTSHDVDGTSVSYATLSPALMFSGTYH
ncbi:MAG: hypothetical protein AB7S68_09025 [Polyangiaceae bacterium]